MKLENYIEQSGRKGYDPYEGLNAPIAKVLKNKYLRLALTQTMKRLPVNLRPFVGIKRDYNPKALGLFASAYCVNFGRTGDKKYAAHAEWCLNWLKDNSSKGYRGHCWGYNFDWQSAVFYLPKGTPTVVNTAFIARAFLDGYAMLGDRSYLDIARSSCDFILHDLNRTPLSDAVNYQSPVTNYPDSFCFSYTPLDRTCIHNANLLAAELLARVYAITKEEELLDSSVRALQFSAEHQNPDGSWFYGFDPKQRSIDSFHTGFVLVSMHRIMNGTNRSQDSELQRVVRNGYEFYKNSFWNSDGLPHYYHDRVYPIDLHCTAQGIITFLELKKYDGAAVARAKRVARWAINNMWDDEKGYFFFQKRRFGTIKIPYLRWPNAWMYYALSVLSAQL